MSEMPRVVYNTYQLYKGGDGLFLLYAASMAVLFILILRTKDRSVRRLFWYGILTLFVFAFPPTAYFITHYGIGKSVYWRVIWIFPMTAVTAFAAAALTGLVPRGKSPFLKGLAALFLMAVIAVGGTNLLNGQVFSFPENPEKLPQAVIDVCEAVKNDAKSSGTEEIRGMFDEDLICYVRQYDGTIGMLYGREALRNDVVSESYTTLASGAGTEEVLNAVRKEDGNYIVLKSGTLDPGECRENGARIVGEVDGYTIMAV